MVKYPVERVANAAGAFKMLADNFMEITGENDCYREYTKAIAMGLSEMADILLDFSIDEKDAISIPKDIKRLILRKFRSKGIIISEITFYARENERGEFIIKAETVKGICVTVVEMARLISECLSVRYVPAENQHVIVNGRRSEYFFRQAPQFDSVVKVSSCCKYGNNVSGDSFTVIKKKDGKQLVCIADGMGAGTVANRDSKLLIELLEQFSEAGFTENAAIRMINTAFSAAKGTGNPVSLDLCVIDNALGVCDFVKLGAVATFIKRKKWVELIKSTSYPMGVLPQVDFDNSVKKLYPGDYIIMISDGVIDSISEEGKEEQFSKLVSELNMLNPKAMADYILDYAVMCGGGVARDDMTVIVTMICNQN